MKRLLILLIRFYQRVLSPLKRQPTCRFIPTCSSYAIEAYRKRGFLAGTILTVGRICRCNPFCKPGYDPVPDRGFKRVPLKSKTDGIEQGDTSHAPSSSEDNTPNEEII